MDRSMSPVVGSRPRLPRTWKSLKVALPSMRVGSFSMKNRAPRCHRNTSAEKAVAQVRTRRR
jgi:hypothetical protein